jgi:hypothetical protein
VDSAPRPSRPAAHPKERKSKSRKGFAGLKRGFFTPEKKKKPNSSQVESKEEPTTLEKAVLLNAAIAADMKSNNEKEKEEEASMVPPTVLDFSEGIDEKESATVAVLHGTPPRGKIKQEKEEIKKVSKVSKVDSCENGHRFKQRCQVCHKRLLAWDLAAGECRCGGMFCHKHGHFMEHNCAFDFATYEKNQLRSKSTADIPLSSRNFTHI